MLRLLVLALFLSVTFTSCDYYSPRKNFRIAISETDYSYNYSAVHLKEFLEQGGYKITIVPADNAIEANRMVANGQADLTFVMNHSSIISNEIGQGIGKLRTVLPVFPRLFYVFAKEPIDTTINQRIFQGKKIGVEVMNGETYANLSSMLAAGRINDVEIVSRDNNPDFIHFWGTSYGVRATELLKNGWAEISLSAEWIKFFSLNNPSLSPYELPAIPGVDNSIDLMTLSAETLLVTRADISEKAIYELTKYIIGHKLDLMRFDKMYTAIDEDFLNRGMLYPIHLGTDQYLKRDLPSFFERYAELIALIFTISAILYGGIQGIRAKMISIKKERIDLYFLEFADIREKNAINTRSKIAMLDDLLQKAVVQMTDEKLDKGDFDIFSRLVQQEIAIHRMTMP